RGPVDSTGAMMMAGSWSAYWHNGLIISSQIARGPDVLELVPRAYLSANATQAAKSRRPDDFNPQRQPPSERPATLALAPPHRARQARLRAGRGSRRGGRPAEDGVAGGRRARAGGGPLSGADAAARSGRRVSAGRRPRAAAARPAPARGTDWGWPRRAPRPPA